jgi:aspartate/methionine/tyrosine aminotransferase
MTHSKSQISTTIPEIKPASRLGEVKEYYFSKKLREIAQMRREGKDIINLGIGSPDLAPSQEVLDEFIEQVNDKSNHAYQGYTGIPELRHAFADWYTKWFGVDLNAASEILPLIGSKEGIMHIAMTFLEAGDETLVPNPGYPAYSAVSNLTGATIREYKLEENNGWLPDLDKLERQDLSRVKIMWISYPNMPTGARADATFLKRLIKIARRNGFLIVNDNPYSFILNDDQQSILSIPGAKDVCLELNSLSKSHNMAGWRIGMLAGKASYLSNILRFKSNMDSGMFKPSQLAAVKALNNPPSWYTSLNAIYKERRSYVFQLLDLLNCTYDINQSGMFVWAKIPEQYESCYDLSDQILHKSNVFLTPGGIFGSQGNKYIRIALCSKIEVFETAITRIKNS